MPRRARRIEKQDCILETDQGDIPYLLRRSSARRSLAITIDEQAKVTVAVPFYTTQGEVHGFIADKVDWIQKCIVTALRNRRKVEAKKFDKDEEFLFLGEKYAINVESTETKRGKIEFNGKGWTVEVPFELDGGARQKKIESLMKKWYRKQAEEVLGGRIFHYSRQIGVAPKKIAVRTQKRIWGNCDYNTQTIHLNWQIILSPLAVVDYVVVHELCHLVHPNHGKRFWRKVEKAMPEYKKYKKWLKKNAIDMVLP